MDWYHYLTSLNGLSYCTILAAYFAWIMNLFTYMCKLSNESPVSLTSALSPCHYFPKMSHIATKPLSAIVANHQQSSYETRQCPNTSLKPDHACIVLYITLYEQETPDKIFCKMSILSNYRLMSRDICRNIFLRGFARGIYLPRRKILLHIS